MKILILTITILFTSFNILYSQSMDVVEIDTISNMPKKTLPFDVPFILKIKQHQKPNFIVIAEHKGNKTLVQSLDIYIDKSSKEIKKKKMKKKETTLRSC